MDIFESYANVCAIEAFLSNWKAAAGNALEESWKSILQLDLPDYGKARLLLSYTSEDQMAFGSNAHMVPSGKPKSVHQTVYMFDRQVSFAIAEKLKNFLKSKTLSANTRQQLEVALTKLLEFRNLHTPMTPPEFQEKLDRIVVKKETMRKTKNLKSAISKPILIEIIHPASS